MPLLATSTSVLKCSYGLTPAPLNILPLTGVMAKMPAGNILNGLPLLNIPSFGMCTSLANPLVAAATAAAFGVLTPMPCLPMTASPWLVGSSKVLTGGMPALHKDCKLLCSYGGCISFVVISQTNVSVSG